MKDQDEYSRTSIKELQTLGIEKICIQDAGEFLLNLDRIGTKLPYQMEVAQILLDRALAAEDRLLAAQILVSLMSMDSIVNSDEFSKNGFLMNYFLSNGYLN